MDQREALLVEAVGRECLRNRGGEAPQVPRERSEAAEGEGALDAGRVPDLQDPESLDKWRRGAVREVSVCKGR